MGVLELNTLKLTTIREREGAKAAGKVFADLYQSLALQNALDDAAKFVEQGHIPNDMDLWPFIHAAVFKRVVDEKVKPYGADFLERIFEFYSKFSWRYIQWEYGDAERFWDQFQEAFGALSRLERAKLFHTMVTELGNTPLVRQLSEKVEMDRTGDIWRFIDFILREDGSNLGDAVMYIDGAWQEMANLALEDAEREAEAAKAAA